MRQVIEISIHALREEGDRFGHHACCCASISIHALREEGDRLWITVTWTFIISIHALREEGDRKIQRKNRGIYHFYPRPPRGGRLSNNAAMSYNSAISIHALREEGDAPGQFLVILLDLFLSTPSARRATC